MVNDTKAAQTDTEAPLNDPVVTEKIASLRAHMRESFGTVVMAMMALPRYRHQSLGDLTALVLEPLIRDRIAMAYPSKAASPKGADMAGMAIWASVSEEVDAKIREQIKAGTFPIRLKADDWTSGDINWLLDVVAQNEKAVASVISNFRQVTGEGELRLHPIIGRLVDKDMLAKMTGMSKAAEPQAPQSESADAASRG